MAIGRLAYDLPAILGVYLAIAILAVIAYTFHRLASVLNFSILGIHPLRDVGNAIDRVIVDGCNDAINTLEKWGSALWNDFKNSVEFAMAMLILLAAGIVWSAGYLWNHLAATAIRTAIGAGAKTGSDLATRVDNLIKDVARNATKAETLIATGVSTAIATAHRYTAQEVAYLDGRIDNVSSGIRDLIPQAVKDAAAAEDLVTGAAIQSLRDAENAAIQAVSDAQTLTETELHNLLGQLDLTDLAKIAGAVPILSLLVQTIATESGLNNAECRQKVKGICGTNLSAWLHFLEGLGLAFAWTSLDDFANELADITGEVTAQITDFVGV